MLFDYLRRVAAVLTAGILTGVMAMGCSENKVSADYAEPKDGFDQLTGSPADGEEIAVIKTNFGDIKVRFFPQFAPKAVENFVTHAKDGYYDGVIFHRVIEGFMIQGGDPDGTGMGGESIWGAPFGVEVTPQLHHVRGALSMAKTNAPISIGSQFFIVQNAKVDSKTATWLRGKKNNPDNEYYDLSNRSVKDENGKLYLNKERFPSAFVDRYLTDGGYPSLDFGYTVFGQVFEGMDVVDEIAGTPTNANDKPLKDVVIESVTIESFKK